MSENRKHWRIPPEPIPDSQIKESFTADVVVVGAGHAGTAVARAAAEGGASVIVIEQMVEEKYWAWALTLGILIPSF